LNTNHITWHAFSDISEVLNTLEAKTTFLAQTLGKLEAFYEQSSFPVEERPIFHIRERMKKGYEEVFYINERTILTFTFFLVLRSPY